MKTFVTYAILVAIVTGVDQGIKGLVESTLPMQEQVDLVPYFALYRTYNTGVAFSMFSSFSGTILIAVSLAVVAFVLYLASKTSPEQTLARVGFALIIGGALGNLIDRTLNGYVIDYFLFHTPVWSFAIFNLADVFITVGASMVLLQEFLGWRRQRAD